MVLVVSSVYLTLHPKLIYESAQTIQQDFIEAWMADYEEEYYTRNEEYYPDDWPSWYYDAGLLVDWQGVLSAETRLS